MCTREDNPTPLQWRDLGLQHELSLMHIWIPAPSIACHTATPSEFIFTKLPSGATHLDVGFVGLLWTTFFGKNSPTDPPSWTSLFLESQIGANTDMIFACSVDVNHLSHKISDVHVSGWSRGSFKCALKFFKLICKSHKWVISLKGWESNKPAICLIELFTEKHAP
jgi:hypothetical protein